ncbi:MAG: Crp/Fnr family transcriptional regulator [Chloroflexi bacterium]|nr:Crp/Fnr family transcriptional regulator [Chloroflexota bacterium]
MRSPPVLAQVPLFTGLAEAELEALASSLRRRSYAKGEVIFHQEDPGSACYIVETGRVKIVAASADGKQVVLALLGPGDLFGEMALLDGEPRSADAVVVEACQLLTLQRDDFLAFLRSNCDASLKLMAALARRLRRTDEFLQDAVFLDVSGRLAKALLDLGEGQGQKMPDGSLVTPRLTQGELAALVGATRESINKWLGYYRDRGLVRYEGGRVTIRKPQELRRYIY